MELIGGQALIEGVMMRNKEKLAMAVKKGKRIIIKAEDVKRNLWFKIPIIRGFLIFLEILVSGIKALIWSANIQEEKEEEKISSLSIYFTILFSILIVVLIFILLPYLLTYLTGLRENSNPIAFNIIDGVIKVVIFIAYLLIISKSKDVYKLFQYHAAEHKTIACYESGKSLTVKNIKKFPKEHARCGTSFIIITLIISIIIFALIPTILKYFFPVISTFSLIKQKSIFFPVRILLIPLIMGVSYEALRISAKFKSKLIMKPLTFPGLLMQKITTKEPRDYMIEVAIVALKKII
ncbi:DUF1385 domain-containing protein [Candidatus Woesearchaeota archaeon]|nr:DUF1385 domain-containing protein [Candidatus Woesearchaeota archaeon]